MWTKDQIAITVAAFLFVCWLVAWLRSQLRPMPAEPEQASEPEQDGDYYYRVTPERVTTGAFARR